MLPPSPRTLTHISKVRSFDPSYTSHGLARFYGREATHSSSLVSMPTRLKPDWCLLFEGFVSSTACPAVRILLAPHASQQHRRPSSARELHAVQHGQAAGVGEGAGTHGLAMAVPVFPLVQNNKHYPRSKLEGSQVRECGCWHARQPPRLLCLPTTVCSVGPSCPGLGTEMRDYGKMYQDAGTQY